MNRVKLSVFLLLWMLLCACQGKEASHFEKIEETATLVVEPAPDRGQVTLPEEQLDPRTFNTFLQEGDLPGRWTRVHYDSRAFKDQIVHVTAFLSVDAPEQGGIAQLIILYDDESQSQRACEGDLKQSGNNWDLTYDVPEIDFQSRADEFKLGCWYNPEEQPWTWCVASARYDRLCTSLTVFVPDDQSLYSWSDLEQTIEAMEQRALEAAGD